MNVTNPSWLDKTCNIDGSHEKPGLTPASRTNYGMIHQRTDNDQLTLTLCNTALLSYKFTQRNDGVLIGRQVQWSSGGVTHQDNDPTTYRLYSSTRTFKIILSTIVTECTYNTTSICNPRQTWGLMRHSQSFPISICTRYPSYSSAEAERPLNPWCNIYKSQKDRTSGCATAGLSASDLRLRSIWISMIVL